MNTTSKAPEPLVITEEELAVDRTGCLLRATGARLNGQVVECPWHFYYMAETDPAFRAQHGGYPESLREDSRFAEVTGLDLGTFWAGGKRKRRTRR